MAGQGPTITLTFAGDADQLAKEAKKAEKATIGVGDAATAASKDMENGAKSSGDLSEKFSKLGNATSGAVDALGTLGDSTQALADVQDMARQKQVRMERALNDVAQAQQDYNQAVQDGKQATLDATQAALDTRQAQLDAEAAQLDYNTAVKESGKDSVEAKQALLDRDQAQADLNQATADGEQALRDQSQATIDAKGAQLDLNDAQSAADPSALQSVADTVGAFTPLLSGLVSVVALATAAQWSLNLAFLANPLTWVIAGIVAVIAVIVLIATKTRWFQEAWSNAWAWITDAASNAWSFISNIPGWIGRAFANVADFISRPFRSAFNFIADAWNNTIGRLAWTVPGWVPFIGGNTISVPNLPRFHSGGMVGGVQGQESLAILQAGERVIPRGQAGSGGAAVVTFAGNLDQVFAASFMQLMRSGQITVTT